jgi:cytochrome P450
MGEMDRLRARYGDLIRLNVPFVAHFITHPDHVEKLLVASAKNCMDRGEDFRYFKPLMGESVLTMNGKPWVEARRRTMQLFGQSRLEKYTAIMARQAEILCERWRAQPAEGFVVDIASEMERLSFAVSAEVFLGLSSPREVDEVREAVRFNARIVGDRMHAPIKLPEWVPTPRQRKGKRLIEAVDRRIREIIIREREAGERKDSALSELVHSQLEMDQLRNDMVTFLVTGYETTGSMMTWTLYCLSRHEAIQRELGDALKGRAKAEELRGSDSLTHPKVQHALKEALRLYPPLLGFSRQLNVSESVGGYVIPGKTILNFMVYLTHRHPEFWPEAEKFIPSRFESPNVAKGHPWAWLPFGGGARVCAGARFAMTEGEIVMDRLLREFHFEFAGGEVIPRINITTMPHGPLLLRVKRKTAG